MVVGWKFRGGHDWLGTATCLALAAGETWLFAYCASTAAAGHVHLDAAGASRPRLRLNALSIRTMGDKIIDKR